MRKWWGIWRGHVWAALVLVFIGLAAFMLWLSAESETPDGRFIFGMAFICMGVLAFCSGMVAAYHWNTKRERVGIRQGTIVVGKPYRQKPAGGDK